MMMFNFKQMSVKPVYNSVPCLIYILDIATIAWQAINLIIALTITKCYGFAVSLVMITGDPVLDILQQYWQELGLLYVWDFCLGWEIVVSCIYNIFFID